jgi:hypothetical protein
MRHSDQGGNVGDPQIGGQADCHGASKASVGQNAHAGFSHGRNQNANR